MKFIFQHCAGEALPGPYVEVGLPNMPLGLKPLIRYGLEIRNIFWNAHVTTAIPSCPSQVSETVMYLPTLYGLCTMTCINTQWQGRGLLENVAC